MFTFYRGAFSQVWLELRSNEALGILDSSYVEDYFGVDGQMSLYHVDSGVRYVVPMSAVEDDLLRGSSELSELPNGLFQLQGRVRDVAGNHTVMNAVSTPFGGERVLALSLQVMDGFSMRHTVSSGPLTLRAATVVPRRTVRKELVIRLGDI